MSTKRFVQVSAQAQPRTEGRRHGGPACSIPGWLRPLLVLENLGLCTRSCSSASRRPWHTSPTYRLCVPPVRQSVAWGEI